MAKIIETVTPVIEVPDSVLGFNSKSKLCFKIGKYEVNAEFDEEYDVTLYSVWIGKHYAQSESLRPPKARDAQEFLYETILKGIFTDGTLEVTTL
jgi:hypothetical protein